jgi:hypothetical protein
MPSSSAAALRFPYFFPMTLIISISFVLASFLLPLQLFRQKIIITLLIGFFVVLVAIKAVLGSSSKSISLSFSLDPYIFVIRFCWSPEL